MCTKLLCDQICVTVTVRFKADFMALNRTTEFFAVSEYLRWRLVQWRSIEVCRRVLYWSLRNRWWNARTHKNTITFYIMQSSNSRCCMILSPQHEVKLISTGIYCGNIKRSRLIDSLKITTHILHYLHIILFVHR